MWALARHTIPQYRARAAPIPVGAMDLPPPPSGGDAAAVRLAFAKRLAAQAFSGRQAAAPATKVVKTVAAPSLLDQRARRSAGLVANPGDQAVYTMDLEQGHSRLVTLRDRLPRIEEACRVWGARGGEDGAAGHQCEEKLIEVVVKELEATLAQCDISVGLLEPGGCVCARARA